MNVNAEDAPSQFKQFLFYISFPFAMFLHSHISHKNIVKLSNQSGLAFQKKCYLKVPSVKIELIIRTAAIT